MNSALLGRFRPLNWRGMPRQLDQLQGPARTGAQVQHAAGIARAMWMAVGNTLPDLFGLAALGQTCDQAQSQNSSRRLPAQVAKSAKVRAKSAGSAPRGRSFHGSAEPCHHSPWRGMSGWASSPSKCHWPCSAMKRPWLWAGQSQALRTTCTWARQKFRRVRTLNTWQAPSNKWPRMAKSPENAKGDSGVPRRCWTWPHSLRNITPAPSIRVMTLSTPGKAEKGPSASICATLTRQSKSSKLAPAGCQSTSRVKPPPFFQGVAGNSCRSNRCRVMVYKSVVKLSSLWRRDRSQNQGPVGPRHPSLGLAQGLHQLAHWLHPTGTAHVPV